MTPEALDALVASGATVEMIAAAWKAEMALSPVRERSKSAQRQQRYRDRQASQSVTERNDVTDDNENVTSPFPPSPPLKNPPDPLKITPPITPQSGNGICEQNPPEPPDENPVFKPEHVVEAWNDVAERCGLPKISKVTETRKRQIRQRMRDSSPAEFQTALGAIERSRWLQGQNDRGWRADFDFFLQPKIFTKLIEGAYDQ